MGSDRHVALLRATNVGVILAALMGNAALLYRVFVLPPVAMTDGLARYERRLSSPKRLLPPDAVIGYLSDLPPDQVPRSEEFAFTRYALAPALLTTTLDQEFVLADFRSAVSPDAPAVPSDLVLVEDLDDGLRLYARKR